MKYEKFDILKKAKYSIVPNNRELFYVECDANDGRKNKVELPDVDNLFENKQEFVDYLNSLYKLYYDEIE